MVNRLKLKFTNQKFQTDAVNAVVDLFEGQEKQSATFSVVKEAQTSLFRKEFGVGNALLIDNKKLLENMHSVQKRNLLPLTDLISDSENSSPISDNISQAKSSLQFSIEVETGTGKTYVYTKTIFELKRRYGFTKFIIVVPSVAIREGVYKSFEITKEHFLLQYDRVPYRYFIYNSAKLSDVRQFATSSNIEIMIINIDAFKKAENIINQAQDKLNGETAMRYIQDTNPIVIIDEPQSVDNTLKSKEGIALLNPLCVFRYSATHREKINLLYNLTPVDAYQMGLVKQICVSSSQIADGFNKAYMKLISVSNKNGFKAKIEMDIRNKSGKISRKAVTIKPGADLFFISGEREVYRGYSIVGIDCTPGFESIEFSNFQKLKLGKSFGNIDENIIKRAQIRQTIETHLEKELRYFGREIKVISLFFIDEVKKYRTENDEKGIYAKMFEESYNELMSLPKFEIVRKHFLTATQSVHNGYFSQDRKGNYKNTRGDTLDDYNVYNTIMKDKEWLLSFDCPLRFIFSHSALKEGWDNPNVFQVCTLIEQKSTFTCRQKVGRGLRLCVDQDGERIRDRNINILHVMANESFADFANKLQKEIEDETGFKFGILQIGLFSGIVYKEKKEVIKSVTEPQTRIIVETLKNAGYIDKNSQPTGKLQTNFEINEIEFPTELEPVKGKIIEIIKNTDRVMNHELENITYTETLTEEKVVSYDDAKELMEHFEEKGYISKDGKIKDVMKDALLKGTLDLSKKFENARERFENIIKKADKCPPIRDASE